MNSLKVLKKAIALLAWLFTWPYRSAIFLWRKGALKSAKRKIKYQSYLLAVGNLTAGGSGKTPHVIYIIDWLFKHKVNSKLATLSRGYGRQTSGFLEATNQSTAKDIGDEPLLIYKRFDESVTVLVSEDRHKALKFKSNLYSYIVLDDAYQQLSLSVNLNILLSNYTLPFYEDTFLPLGRLREHKSQAERADCLIFTKCPNDLSYSKRKELYEKAKVYLKKNTPIFFSSIVYDELKPLKKEFSNVIIKNAIVVCGLADAKLFIDKVKSEMNVLKVYDLKDHFKYNKVFIKKLVESYNSSKEPSETAIITTEKDIVKLLNSEFDSLIDKVPIFYWTISVDFGEDAQSFHAFLNEKIP